MKFLTAAATLLAAVGVQAGNTCTGFDKNDLLQSGRLAIYSGTVEFSNKERSKESCFNININYDVPNSGF